MGTLLYNLGQAVGTAIIHSLWQALLVYLLFRVVIAALPGIGAGGKYNLSVAALLSIMLWFLTTLFTELYNQSWTTGTALVLQNAYPLSIQAIGKSAVQVYHDYSLSLRPHLPYISLLYMCGLILQTTRLLWHRQQLTRLKQSFVADDTLGQQVSRLAKRLSLNKTVLSGFSDKVTVPCVAGYLKPILFLPASVFTCLSPAEIEAIIIHELAHVKRHDYLVNYMQQLLATLMFFNPFTHLINRIINTERENCCDDFVVSVTGQPLNYAYALLKLQEAQPQHNSLALAATGKNYTLLNRIERIMKTQKPSGNIRHLTFSLALLACSICSIAWLNPEFKDGKLMVTPGTVPAAMHTLLTDTLPKPPNPPKPPKAPKVRIPKTPKAPKTPILIEGNNLTYFNDPKLNRLSKEVDKQAAALDRYYNNPKFAKLRQQWEKTVADADMYYNSPEIKQLQAKFDKQSAAFEALHNNPEIGKLNSQMDELSKNIDNYYNTAAYKRALSNYENAAKGLGDMKNYNSAAYKKRQDEFQKVADNFNKYQHNPAIQDQQEQLRKLSEKMREFYNSPEYIKKSDAIKNMSDSIGKAFQNKQTKVYRQQMDVLQKQLSQYQSSPELKKAHERLQQASKRLSDYTSSSEFKRRHSTYMSINYDRAPRKETVETIEIKEKPEMIEIKEKPEKIEIIEKPLKR